MCYYIHFWTNTLGKGMNLLVLSAVDQIVSLLFKDGCGIKLPMKVDVPLKPKKPNQTKLWNHIILTQLAGNREHPDGISAER